MIDFEKNPASDGNSIKKQQQFMLWGFKQGVDKCEAWLFDSMPAQAKREPTPAPSQPKQTNRNFRPPTQPAQANKPEGPEGHHGKPEGHHGKPIREMREERGERREKREERRERRVGRRGKGVSINRIKLRGPTPGHYPRLVLKTSTGVPFFCVWAVL